MKNHHFLNRNFKIVLDGNLVGNARRVGKQLYKINLGNNSETINTHGWGLIELEVKIAEKFAFDPHTPSTCHRLRLED